MTNWYFAHVWFFQQCINYQFFRVCHARILTPLSVSDPSRNLSLSMEANTRHRVQSTSRCADIWRPENITLDSTIITETTMLLHIWQWTLLTTLRTTTWRYRKLYQMFCKIHNYFTSVHNPLTFSILTNVWVREWVIKFSGLSGDSGQRSPYKPCNQSLYIGIIIFPRIDNTQST